MNERRELIYESIIRDMSEGIITIGLSGVIETFNPAAERILRKKREEMLGRRYATVFIRDRSNDVFNQAVLDAMYDPLAKHEAIVPYHDGEQTKQLYMVTSFLLHEGQKIGTIVVFGDITELAELRIRYAQDIALLMDSLVKALSTAIDERSHYNANHTRNMVRMAEAFLSWMADNGDPWHYDEDERHAFIMSVSLHDVGKLSVPLEIMDKATRLGPKMEKIRERFKRLKLLDRIAILEGRLSAEDYDRARSEEEEILAFISKVNEEGFLPEEDLERIKSLSTRTFVDEDGETHRLLSEDEVTMLSIRKGTLTTQERSVMQGHAASTWNILSQVRFPKKYENVPVWASCHHELLDGTGYPNRIFMQDISREERLLTILDIFEALTARDRPYKPPIPLAKAWAILDSMVQQHKLDGELLAAFRESGAWKQIVDP
ncbi:MAG: PAS domain S-box protein [Clostridia bacterium]|nr:PAS domain S-box protein [Clostridia bacterium]